ncbi:ammonia-forming cytochrome c nitrite reductase subunit c552 [Azoarcus sp. DN11]|uniref:ammonia-forming cytochrome c nitrite reductase subunit c552 n=1 Tax=Azoarcus sp. DN11 TaxID=356837 RepID=UPI0013E2E90E|nr:ammonia-forming cytochrome c nitrite reductase subunit c552 [Azoarcus sp. DN11]
MAQTTLTPTETFSAAREAHRVESGQKFFGDAKYAGSDSCKSCHEKQYGEWKNTWHSKMQRLATPDVVVGDFNNRIVTYKDVAIKDKDGHPAKDKDGKEIKLTFQVRAHREGDKFFFTVLDQDNPANNQTYEIYKALGGKWDQQYEIKVGDNLLPGILRWSVANNGWIVNSYRPDEWVIADGTPDGRPRKPEELPKNRFAEAKCSGCHTTGNDFYKDEAGVWKAKPNGTSEMAVACERCHGPASKHVAEAEEAKAAGKKLAPEATTIVHPLKDLNSLQQLEMCAQCHGRHSNKEIPDINFQLGFRPGDVDMTTRARFWNYSSTPKHSENHYFWVNDWAARNRQQWQDFTKSKHFSKAGMSCLTCHTFHGEWENAQLRMKPEQLCVSCHASGGYAKRPNAEMFKDSPMEKAGVQCVDCHMPKIGYRSDKTATKPHPWDVTAHTFMVAKPELELRQEIRSSCTSCHVEGNKLASGAQAPAFDINTLDVVLKQKQSMTRAEIDAVEAVLTKAEQGKSAEAKKLMADARGKLNFVLLDGSMGFHNQEKAMNYIAEARKLAEKAVKSK